MPPLTFRIHIVRRSSNNRDVRRFYETRQLIQQASTHFQDSGLPLQQGGPWSHWLRSETLVLVCTACRRSYFPVVDISIRPVDYAGQRFNPSDLVTHRLTHDFLGPGCLCSLRDPQRPDFVESAIYLSTMGSTTGEYVASCAYGQCGYFGEQRNSNLAVDSRLNFMLVFLERVFDKNGLPIKRYPARGMCNSSKRIVLVHMLQIAPFEDPPPSIELLVPETPDFIRVPLKRTYAMLGEFFLSEIQRLLTFRAQMLQVQ